MPIRETVCIIPARSGSKRIKNKNIKPFKGKPMIERAIEIAKLSKLFDDIIVTTNDPETSRIALNAGASVPFMRPENLSDDFTGTSAVIIHAIKQIEKNNKNYSYVCCIYPCTPFLEVEDLQITFNMLVNGNKKFVYPISKYETPIQRALERNEDGSVNLINPKHFSTRTQDLEPRYFDSGSFYWGQKSAWLNNLNILAEGNTYIVPSWRTIDIDTEDDWKRAEIISDVIKNII